MDKTTIATIAAGTAVVSSSVDNAITRHKVKKLSKEAKRLNRSAKVGRFINIALEITTAADIAYKTMSHSSLNKRVDDLQNDLEIVKGKYDEMEKRLSTIESEHNISDRLSKVESDVKVSQDIENLKNRTDFLKAVLDERGITQPTPPPPAQSQQKPDNQ